MRVLARTCCLLLALSAAAPAVRAAEAGRATGLPVPRHVSLGAAEVNMRAGPGARYPVEWVYKRRGLPVEVVDEFGHWRKVRDFEGVEGWVHRSMLSGARAAVTIGKTRTLRRGPEDSARPVARLEPGVVGELGDCREGWCEIRAGGFSGWIDRRHVWGAGAGDARGE